MCEIESRLTILLKWNTPFAMYPQEWREGGCVCVILLLFALRAAQINPLWMDVFVSFVNAEKRADGQNNNSAKWNTKTLIGNNTHNKGAKGSAAQHTFAGAAFPFVFLRLRFLDRTHFWFYASKIKHTKGSF